MKIAATVILFNPEEDVIANISSYYPHIGHLYICDNSAVVSEAVKQFCSINKHITLMHDGNNDGIAKRLNQAARAAIADGYEWLLTMDQDSCFKEGLFTSYKSCLTDFENATQVAMFGIEYDSKLKTTGDSCNFKEMNYLITSGSILNLALFKQVGEFDEALFIDEVDLEYCYRAKKMGLRIVKFTQLLLDHQLGKVSYFRSLKSLQLTPRTLHSPLRVYYMVRNYLYVDKLYRGLFNQDDTLRRKGIVNRLKNNLLYGNKRWQTVKYIFQAYSDFKRNKMGKIN